MLVATVVLAAAAVSVSAGAAGATGTPSSGTNVLVVMNPSKRAVTTEVRHVKAIFGQVSTLPGLRFFGIYEQRSSDDGPPFDRPFVMTQTPETAALKKPSTCSETKGTDYQKSACKKEHEKTRAENAKLVADWRTQITSQIDKAGRTTEEAKHWDLPGALSRAGANLSALPGQDCLVLLGGLAVQSPPTRVNLASLKGVRILVTGWRSTGQVQTLWTKRMRDIGAAIEFLPADVTDFMLNDAVTRCTTITA